MAWKGKLTLKLPEYHNTTSAKYIAYRCEPGATAVDDKLYMVGFKFTVESAVVRVSSADLTGNALSPARKFGTKLVLN